MDDEAISLRAVGVVESPLRDPQLAPKQGEEGGPKAWIVLWPDVAEALDGVTAGDRVIVLTWLHLASRDRLRVHPRGDEAQPLRGVFATRSPDRPNPIGLHVVEVVTVSDARLRVQPLEAVDGTPVIDIKPLLPGDLAAS